MADPARVRFAPEVAAAIRAAAREAYPHEGCGALIGPPSGPVTETIPLPNRETDKPRVRFAVSPRDYLEVEDAADARGLQLLGFWHSHPDHPARPSETDRRYAWEGLLTVVIAVAQGVPQEMTAWDVPGPEAPFRRLEIAEE
jgi:proteasome lid subunit RPN8/RPN11